nr:MAG TPA: hypothetical protein [Caudoviricetes sp.]
MQIITYQKENMKENLELNCSIIFIISIYKVMFSSTLYI